MIQLALFVLFLFPAFTVSGQIQRNICIALCLLCCHPKVSMKIREPGILLLVWFVWACLCSFLSDNWLMSLFGFHRRFEGLNAWVLAIAFGYLFWRTSSLKMLYWTLLAIMSICLGTMLIYPDLYGNMIFGHIAIAAFVSVASCILMAWHPAFILCCLPFIALTHNRSMMLAMVAGIVSYAILEFKGLKMPSQWLLLGFITLLGAGMACWPKLSKIDPLTLGTGSRMGMAMASIDAFAVSPWIGYGIDTQSTVFGRNTDEHRDQHVGEKVIKRYLILDRCHNWFLDVLMQTGLPGLVLWLFLATRMAFTAYKWHSKHNIACFLGFIGAMAFGSMNPFGIPVLFLLCLCILGVRKEIFQIK